MHRHFVAILSMFLGLSSGVVAEEATKKPEISVELNAVDNTESGCKLTFVAINRHTANLTKLVYEAVLFDTNGRVDRLTLFDFGALPSGRQRVRQFVVPEVKCETIGQILFNGTNTCESDVDDTALCDATLAPSSRTDIEVSG